jgi:hypothetical protein
MDDQKDYKKLYEEIVALRETEWNSRQAMEKERRRNNWFYSIFFGWIAIGLFFVFQCRFGR